MTRTSPPPGARLHEAGVTEISLLGVMHAQCFAEAWTVESLAEVMAMAGVRTVIATLDEGGMVEPAGFALTRVAADEAELLTLGVILPARNRGIGGLLLDAAIEHALAAGAWRLFLEVAEDNHAARALYASRGFTTVGRRPDYYHPPGGRPVAALTLRRSLAPAAAAAWTWPPF